MFKPLAIATFLFSVPGLAQAQDIFVPPVTTANPGYLFPNDQYQRNPQAPAASTGRPNVSVKTDVELDAAAQARIRAAVEALAPEYNQRRQRDGETRANDWIRQKAFELGQQEADAMKQRLGLE